VNFHAVTERLLLGSSYLFQQAVRAALAGVTVLDEGDDLERNALAAAALIVVDAFTDQNEWRMARSIEAIHHAEWLWKKARALADGPPAQAAA
jgi:hypothetical protein